MKEKFYLIAALFVFLSFTTNTVSAQFTIKIPKLKTEKPKMEQGRTDANTTNQTSNQPQPKTADSNLIYKRQTPNDTPVLMKNTIYVQAKTHNEYWKMPNQRNYSSWIPLIRFSHFYNNEKTLNYTVEYFNPDGSTWYSEKLEQSNTQAGDRTVLFQSPSPYGNGVLDTKSTAGTGVYSFKITNQDTKEVLYQGKFKVGKFGTGHSPQEKNKADFYVEHDWLLPFGTIGFHFSNSIEIGGVPPLVSVWLKGMVSANELEGRIFYKGQQIASTKDGGGASDYDERTSGFAAAFAPNNIWKRWQFQWSNFLYDNNGTFNRDNYPNAHYADKNPGEYTVKIYRNDKQIRELSFTVGADGKFVVPGYTSQIFMPYHHIVLPVKVTDATEKWNVNSWKTDAFYGNPLSGFTVQ